MLCANKFVGKMYINSFRRAMFSTSIRTRFAPSPTGSLHLGGLRTALYCYLMARKDPNNGAFIVRVEDTDQTRTVEGAREEMQRALHWAGLSPDEGPSEGGPHAPYIQSERLSIYGEYVDRLLHIDAAYPCFCSESRLEEVRALQAKRGHVQMYDRMCSTLSVDDASARIAAGESHVIRQRIPVSGETVVHDAVRGRIAFPNKQMDDTILLKSDGFPSYHLCSVIDDHLMQITHVIRGEEWLPSLPKHFLLYDAFGWTPPVFAHLPLLLERNGQKLSKRGRDLMVASSFMEGDRAVLRAAMLNFLAFLGWHPGNGVTQEVFNVSELSDAFTLDRVQKGGSVVNLEKLGWFNAQHWNASVKAYLEDGDPHKQHLTHPRLVELFALVSEPVNSHFKDEIMQMSSQDFDHLMLNLILRASTSISSAGDFVHIATPFFQSPWNKVSVTAPKVSVDLQPETVRNIVMLVLSHLGSIAAFEDSRHAFGLLKQLSKTHKEYSVKAVMLAVRYALTCEGKGVNMGDMMFIMGRDRCMERLNECVERLNISK